MKKIQISIIALLSIGSLWAQQPKDTLNTEVINVVKPYTPSISDAFKIKDIPSVSNEDIAKEPIEYHINSAPVASTFTPSKGKAKGVTKPKKERLYDNYLSVGFGMYTTPLIDAYVRTFPNRDSEVGLLLKHHSSQGGIKDILLDDSFYDSSLDVYYKVADRAMDWKLNLGVKHQLYNWYGLPETITEEAPILEDINPRQSYLNVALDGEINYYNSFFKAATASLNRLGDNYGSNEIRVRIKPVFEMPISSEVINFQFDIDFLTGTFDRDYSNISKIDYSYLNFGVIPNFEVLRDDLSINLGAKLYFAADIKDGEGKFKAYPNVDASYRLVDEVLTVFAGATGGLHFNSYLNQTQSNPFISPNLFSVPTDERYRFFGGVKGKLASNINYLFKASFADERNKALHQLNPSKFAIVPGVEEAYELGNSFGVVYDDVQTLAFYGELAIDLSKEVTFGGNLNYATYTLENQEKAWNLPNLKASLFADYHANKWTGAAKLFIVGERNDYEIPFGLTNTTPENFFVDSGTYMDLNVEVSYAFTNRLSAFAKGNNLIGTKYKRFYNYPVQGLQVLGGITYKFDL